MSLKARSNILVGILFLIPLFYNNCAPSHNEGSFNGVFTLSSKCDKDLQTAFKPYHAVLRQKCSACHVAGGIGNGQFADMDETKAFNVFKLKTETKVYTYATDPNHKPPNTGTANVALLDLPRQSWNAALASYNTCMEEAPTPPGPPGGGVTPPATIPQPTILTINKNVNLVPGTPQTITWQMSTELADPTLGFAGATLVVTVEGFAGAPDPYIVISNPRVRGGNTQSLYTKNMGVFLNNVFVPAPSGLTFQTGERYIPAAAQRPFMDSGGAMIVTVPSLNGLPISFGFEKFEASTLDGFPIVFDPPTFANLVSTNNGVPAVKRVFATRCVSCHSAANPASGINLTSYAGLRNGGYVVPFKPDESIVYLSISSGSMPPAGALPPEERDSVRFWIMDGAPQ